jgi:glycosyltransferase involved in cell wall biosynthesis
MNPLPVRTENADAVGYVSTTPAEGIAQLEVLKRLGCEPHHRVLEVGCGALVAGFPVMQYLDAGNYAGIDPNRWLFESSLRVAEVSSVNLDKRPRFFARSDFRTGTGEKFNFIFSHSILSHASNDQLTDFFAAAAEQLAEGGVLAASIRFAEGNEFGSPGSARHGAAFTEWQYPGVSWFTRAEVVERAKRAGLPVYDSPELTRTILAGNPKAVHDWVCTKVAARARTTLVTGFFRLPDRAVDEDEQFRLFDQLAASGLPILLFLDERLVDRAPTRANVRVVPTRLGDLWPFALVDGRELRLPGRRNEEKDTRGFLLLQNAKLDLLREATKLDARSTHFAWIDFGIMKVARDPAGFLARLARLAPPATCARAPGCWTRDRADQADDDAVNWRFCGGFLLADRGSVDGLVDAHRTEFAQRALHRGRLTWEVNTWAAMERAGAKFDWYRADHDDSIIGDESKRVCLTMIVKNESAVIERCLAAALPHIDAWAITDTGSTDDTVDRVERFFAARGVPGALARAPFRDFAQARNASLDHARAVGDWDYALLVDADMVLCGTLDKSALRAPAYKIEQRDGRLDYWNTRLVRRDAPARYVGVTHEFLSVEGAEILTGLYVDDRNDGGSRGDKAERDIRLLSEGLVAEPHNGRYMFYLANTYRETGRHAEAIQWYARRIAVGGWDEEVWYAHYSTARCYQALGDEPNFLKACVDAYDFRPTRGEPLKLLARHYRERGRSDAAALFAEALAAVDYPRDELFVEREVYDGGADQEIAIAGYYSKLPRRREAAYQACADLTVHPNAALRDEAAGNFVPHYVKSARDLFGARVEPIDWDPGDGYKPMNPSVCVGADGRRLVLVRTVNYAVTDQGEYPTVDGSAVIRTRNHVVEVDAAWRPIGSTPVGDASGVPRSAFPVEGFEDCRLWQWGDRYLVSATVRDLADNADGRCEIAIASLDAQWRVCGVRPVRDYESDRAQKNWMPIAGRPGQFLYLCDPTIAIDASRDRTVEVARHQPPVHLAHLRGGSQLVAHEGGWLCLTHEVSWRPGRVYLHRFVWFDGELRVRRVSDPFYFVRLGIEFCAGLAHDPGTGEFVASFGVNDASAHLAHFDPERLNEALRSVG